MKFPKPVRLFLFVFLAWVFYSASFEFWNIAWGSGEWLGEFSLKWGLLFFFFVLFNVSLLVILSLSLWKKQVLAKIVVPLLKMRKYIGAYRFLLIGIVLLLPVWVFQYSYWGFIFSGTYFRLFVWGIVSVVLGVQLSSRNENTLLEWRFFLGGLTLSGTVFTLASVFSNVTDYPFNLFWSDGNRIWDYSVLFGRDLYNYPPEQHLEAFIATGRQFLWGIPFLFQGVSIFWVRFWSAFVLTFPYMVLGWWAFRESQNQDHLWFFAGLWTFLFLNQGPIYTPLVLSAILIALAWRRPLWIAVPLIFIAGYYAQASRWTWLFAPAIWAVILEISKISTKKQSLSKEIWTRTFWAGGAGFLGGYLMPKLLGAFKGSAGQDISVGEVSNALTRQPLLWYRLLPNDTYPEGVLLGLFFAITPLIILLVYSYVTKKWQLLFWQKVAILTGVFAFLVVGVIISTKIGGGNNLHNLDMLLIMLIFLLAIAWRDGALQGFLSNKSFSIKIVMVLLIVLPALKPLLSLRPQLYITPENLLQVQTLTDFDPEINSPIPVMLSKDQIQKNIEKIEGYVVTAAERGEVLFMDQRQLLTFGHVPPIPLVPDYEKKYIMEQAMRSNSVYFLSYYEDLATQRFSLIVTEPLRIKYQGQEGSFGEENDAWTKWVVEPTLCFYEPIETLKAVGIQLLIPRDPLPDCSIYFLRK